MPAADVKEVEHGQWIYEDDLETGYTTKAICSCCKKVVENNYHLNQELNRRDFKKENPFCRKCGAKMDKEYG